MGFLGVQLRQVKLDPLPNRGNVSPLDGMSQSVASLDAHVQRPLRGPRHALQQLGKTRALYRRTRGQHADVAVARQGRCRLERRLHANERQIGVGMAQPVDGERGGGVAGDHQRVNPVLGPQLRGHPMCSIQHHLGSPFAIGRVGVVCQVDKMHLGQLGTQRAQHAETTDAAVENADGGHLKPIRRRRRRCP